MAYELDSKTNDWFLYETHTGLAWVKFNLQLWLHDKEFQIVQFLDKIKHFLADFRPSSEWSHRPNTNHSKFLQFIPEGHLKPRKEVGFVSPTEHPVIKTSILPVQSQRLRRLGQSLLTYILHTEFNFQTIIQALHWHVHWCGPSLSS